jgi:proteasome lid subunit RPN8/RPN11
MDLILSSNDHQQLLHWALEAGENECCGILRGTGRRVRAVELTRNVAPDPARHFEIDPAALIAAHKSARAGGLPLLGYFHSHPNGIAVPSVMDVAQAAPDGLIWLIMAPHSITAWQPVVSGARVSGFTPVSVVVEG